MSYVNSLIVQFFGKLTPMSTFLDNSENKNSNILYKYKINKSGTTFACLKNMKVKILMFWLFCFCIQSQKLSAQPNPFTKPCLQNKVIAYYLFKPESIDLKLNTYKPINANLAKKWRLFFENLIQSTKGYCLISNARLIYNHPLSAGHKSLFHKSDSHLMKSEFHFLRGEDLISTQAYENALQGFLNNPGVWGSWVRTYLMAASMAEAHNKRAQAAQFMKKAILLNAQIEMPDPNRYSPWFRMRFKQLYHSIQKQYPLIQTNLKIKGAKKETPIFVNGEFKGYGKTVNFLHWTGQMTRASAGGSHQSEVYTLKAGESLTIKAKPHPKWHLAKEYLTAQRADTMSRFLFLINPHNRSSADYAIIMRFLPETKNKKFKISLYNNRKEKVVYEAYFDNRFHQKNKNLIQYHIQKAFGVYF